MYWIYVKWEKVTASGFQVCWEGELSYLAQTPSSNVIKISSLFYEIKCVCVCGTCECFVIGISAHPHEDCQTYNFFIVSTKFWNPSLFFILQTGGTEEVYKEQKRQQELENNYRFVWGESQEESQSSSTSDSDDVDIWAHSVHSVHLLWQWTPVETSGKGDSEVQLQIWKRAHMITTTAIKPGR